MENLELENQELREEMTSMRTKIEELTESVKSLATAQIPPPPPPSFSTPAWTFVTNIPASTVSVSTPQHTMPEGHSWDVPICLGEVFHP